MTADLQRSAPELTRVLRRRDDAKRLTTVDEEDAVRRRIERERIGWPRLGEAVPATAPEPSWFDAPRRKTDLEAMLRGRADGTLDIVPLSDSDAATLGLRRPTLRMRVAAFLARLWRVARVWS